MVSVRQDLGEVSLLAEAFQVDLRRDGVSGSSGKSEDSRRQFGAGFGAGFDAGFDAGRRGSSDSDDSGDSVSVVKEEMSVKGAIVSEMKVSSVICNVSGKNENLKWVRR